MKQCHFELSHNKKCLKHFKSCDTRQHLVSCHLKWMKKITSEDVTWPRAEVAGIAGIGYIAKIAKIARLGNMTWWSTILKNKKR